MSRGDFPYQGRRGGGNDWLRDRANLTEAYAELMEVQYLAIRAAVRCRTCEADRGRDCRTKAGNAALVPHVSRKEDWRAFISERYGAVLLG